MSTSKLSLKLSNAATAFSVACSVEVVVPTDIPPSMSGSYPTAPSTEMDLKTPNNPLRSAFLFKEDPSRYIFAKQLTLRKEVAEETTGAQGPREIQDIHQGKLWVG
jgi:hypothetical protein